MAKQSSIQKNNKRKLMVKKLLFSTKMDIMHWTEYAYIKTTQLLQANLMVTL